MTIIVPDKRPRGRPKSEQIKVQKIYTLTYETRIRLNKLADRIPQKKSTLAKRIIERALMHPQTIRAGLNAQRIAGAFGVHGAIISIYAVPEFHDAIREVADNNLVTPSRVVEACLRLVVDKLAKE